MERSNKSKKIRDKHVLEAGVASELEHFMIIHNLKLTKSDISIAARKINIPISKAMIHFQRLQKELATNKMKKSSQLLHKIKNTAKKIKRIEKRINEHSIDM